LTFNLAQRNIGIGCRHLLQGWRNHSAWTAPFCPEIDERHLPGRGAKHRIKRASDFISDVSSASKPSEAGNN
jgi:hypothetical protein